MESFLLRLYKKDASAKVVFHTSSVTYQFWIVLINLTHSLIDAYSSVESAQIKINSVVMELLQYMFLVLLMRNLKGIP